MRLASWRANATVLDTGASVKSAAPWAQPAARLREPCEPPPKPPPEPPPDPPVGTDWLGGRTDVILQLVFTPDGRLADGNFEEIRSLR